MTVEVPTFVIQRFPVTFGEWFDFLEELRTRDPALAEAHTPRTTVGASSWELAKSGMIIDPYKLPVFGVSAVSAEVYAAWLSEKQGRTWRLPTEVEWEKAGRGTDGRVYPWGEHFDATFCKMRDSRDRPLAPRAGRRIHGRRLAVRRARPRRRRRRLVHPRSPSHRAARAARGRVARWRVV